MTIEQMLIKVANSNDENKVKIFNLNNLIVNAKRGSKNIDGKIQIKVPKNIINYFLGGDDKAVGFLISISEEEFKKWINENTEE